MPKIRMPRDFRQAILFLYMSIASVAAYAHSVAVFLETNSNNEVRFHVLSWHSPSEFGGRASGAMFVNGTRYNFAGVLPGGVPSTYRLVASCSNWSNYNNSRFAYQSTSWIPGSSINLCQRLNFSMTSNILETPACTLSGTVDLSAPLIVSQPSANTNLCSGNNLSVSITASGLNLSYQWERLIGTNWSPITSNQGYSGFNSPNLIYNGVDATMNNTAYRCIVTSTVGNPCPKTTSVTSNTLTIRVAASTSITNPATPIAACNGSALSLAVTASGTSLTYRWEYSANQGGSWTPINNATSASLNFNAGASVAYQNGNYIRAVATGTCGSASSNPSILTVNRSTQITGNPSNRTICEGVGTNFSITADGNGLTYQWQVKPSGASAFTNLTNNTVYSGSNSSTLTLSAANASLNGATYRCVVNGTCSPLSLNSNEASLSVNSKPAVTIHPAATVSSCAPAVARFSVSTIGTSLSYQWQDSTNTGWNNISSPAYSVSSTSTGSTLTITPNTSMNGYRYRCIVSGTCTPSVTSNSGMLNVLMPASISSQPTSLSPSICEGTNASFGFTATGTGLTYKWRISSDGGNTFSDLQSSGSYQNVNTNTLTIVGLTASMHGFRFRGVATGTCGAPDSTSVITLSVKVLPRITSNPSATTVCMPVSPEFTVQASGSGLSYKWQRNVGGGSFSDLSDNQPFSGTATTTLSITTDSSLDNTKYRIKIKGECSPDTVFSNPVTLVVHRETIITQQPSNKEVCIYGRTYISLTNLGLGNAYQWEESSDSNNNSPNWTPLTNFRDPNSGFSVAGANKDSLLLSGVPFEKNGMFYRCRITSNCPSGTPTITYSNPAQLTVLRKPLVTVQPVNANNNLNVNNVYTDPNTATYIFNTTATGRFNNASSASIFQWFQSTDGGATWTSIPDAGGTIGSNSYTETTTVTPAYTSRLAITIPKNSTVPATKHLFRCLVSGVCDFTTTRAVTINPPPKIR